VNNELERMLKEAVTA